jgi:hypothetical protein
MVADTDVSSDVSGVESTEEVAEERRVAEQYEVGGEWQAGVLGGLIGGAVMGVVWTFQSPGVLEAAIPALYGLSGGLAGWIVHMVHSAVFGLVFAALLTRGSLRRYGERVASATGTGVVYGVVLWIVAAGLVMPYWLSAVGFAGAPPLPNLSTMGLLTHVLYGLFLGVAYPTLARTFRPEGQSPIMG